MDGKKQNMDYVENSTRRSQPWRSNAVDRSIVFGLHGMRCKGWSSSSSVQNQAGQEIDDDKGGWRKSPNERKTFVGKDHCLELMIRRVMPKNALKNTVNEQKEKECIFSPTRGNTMHIRSPDSTERLWNIWRALCSMCSDCSEMHVFGKNWRTWFSMVSKYSGTISNKIVDRTPNHNTHLCTVCSQARNASHALGSSHTDCSVIFVRLQRICHLIRTCLTLCCSLTCRVPRTHDLPHSLFLLPRHKNTQHNRDNMIISKKTQYIMNFTRLSQSTSSAIKDHSGVKTCRVAETRARLLPQVMSPRSLRLSRGSKIILEIHSNYVMHRKNVEDIITELRSLKK